MTRRNFLSRQPRRHFPQRRKTNPNGRIFCSRSRTIGAMDMRALMAANGSIHRHSTEFERRRAVYARLHLQPEVQSLPRYDPYWPEYVAVEGSDHHYSIFPNDFATYPAELERAGYFVGMTGKGWGPGDFKSTGFEHNPAGCRISGAQGCKPSNRLNNTNDYAKNFEAFSTAPSGRRSILFLAEPRNPIGHMSRVGREGR